MKKVIYAAKDPSRGVFWVIDGELYAFPFEEGNYEFGVAKAGNTYNHERLWDGVKPRGCNKEYNYYPRGRVDFNGKGKPVLFMNPNIGEEYLPDIRIAFGLREDPIIKYDYSEHYKCYLD